VELYNECGKYLETHKSLSVTEVTHSEAGKLRPAIKYVILAAGPPAGMFADDKQLYDAVVRTFFNCMRYANERLKVCSISIPAISSGTHCDFFIAF
jgi:O-acetyl-ADP-ribose deacetylase (regulator of RNase III)